MDLSWSPINISCEPIHCPALNATCSRGTEFQSICQVPCPDLRFDNQSFTSTGVVTKTCQADRTWSEPNAGQVQAKCKPVTCDHGANMGNMVTFLAYLNLTFEIVFRFLTQQSLYDYHIILQPDKSNGDWKCPAGKYGVLSGQSCDYTCKKGFTTNVYIRAVCQDDGNWKSDDSNCIA